jgi:maltose O-acetyltransferase
MILKNMYYKCKAEVKKRRFKNNSITGSYFSCTHGSNCINLSGKKEHIKIGNHCEICGILSVNKNGKIIIGNYTTIRYGSSIEAAEMIKIGDYVIISNNVIIRDNNSHPIEPDKRIELCKSGFESELWNWEHAISKQIIINDNVWIGERAIIYKGVEIGKGSIIAGGSVVTHSVPDYVIAAGNPAKVVKYIR